MILAFIIFLLIRVAQSQDCVFDVSSKTAPYIVNENFTFPTTLRFGIDDTFYVACPKGTFSTYIAEEGDRVACKGGTQILNIRTVEVFDFSNIKCNRTKTTSTTSTKHLNEPCENNGTIIEVGFEIYRNFVSELSICFDEIHLRPFYVKYDNKYSSLKRVKPSPYLSLDDYLKCPDGEGNCTFVDNGNVFLNNNLDAAYLNQENTFEKLGVFSDETLRQFPLAVPVPKENFPEEFPQRVQGYPYWEYVNFVPVWNTLWGLLLYYLPGFRISRHVSYVGTLGVATLPDDNGNLVELYLLDNQMPVPKWIWHPAFFNNEPFIMFFYNTYPGRPKPEGDDLAEICADGMSTLDDIITQCPFESVTAPGVKSFIANKCPNPLETYCQ